MLSRYHRKLFLVGCISFSILNEKNTLKMNSLIIIGTYIITLFSKNLLGGYIASFPVKRSIMELRGKQFAKFTKPSSLVEDKAVAFLPS